LPGEITFGDAAPYEQDAAFVDDDGCRDRWPPLVSARSCFSLQRAHDRREDPVGG
jgi:hypothetical protein